MARGSLRDCIVAIKQLIREQMQAEIETKPNTINPSIVALHYLTRLMKYRRYKEISALTSDTLLGRFLLFELSSLLLFSTFLVFSTKFISHNELSL
jgi:hypothetical protein